MLVSAEHERRSLLHDASSVWLEDITTTSFKICARELQNFDGAHQNIHIVSIFPLVTSSFFAAYNLSWKCPPMLFLNFDITCSEKCKQRPFNLFIVTLEKISLTQTINVLRELYLSCDHGSYESYCSKQSSKNQGFTHLTVKEDTHLAGSKQLAINKFLQVSVEHGQTILPARDLKRDLPFAHFAPRSLCHAVPHSIMD